MPEVHTK